MLLKQEINQQAGKPRTLLFVTSSIIPQQRVRGGVRPCGHSSGLDEEFLTSHEETPCELTDGQNNQTTCFFADLCRAVSCRARWRNRACTASRNEREQQFTDRWIFWYVIVPLETMSQSLRAFRLKYRQAAFNVCVLSH